MADLTEYISNIKVSSILDDDDQFDKYHLIDGKLETCWNSDEGDVQFVYFKFSKPLNVQRLELTFQGGFGAEHIQVQAGEPIQQQQNDENDDADDSDDDCDEAATKNKIGLNTVAQFNSQDASSTQSFEFTAENAYALKITFTQMADMFGRVILYDMKVYGDVAQ